MVFDPRPGLISRFFYEKEELIRGCLNEFVESSLEGLRGWTTPERHEAISSRWFNFVENS